MKEKEERRGKEGLPARWVEVEGATIEREDSWTGLEEEKEK